MSGLNMKSAHNFSNRAVSVKRDRERGASRCHGMHLHSDETLVVITPSSSPSSSPAAITAYCCLYYICDILRTCAITENRRMMPGSRVFRELWKSQRQCVLSVVAAACCSFDTSETRSDNAS